MHAHIREEEKGDYWEEPHYMLGDGIWEAGNEYLTHSLGVHVSESPLECI